MRSWGARLRTCPRKRASNGSSLEGEMAMLRRAVCAAFVFCAVLAGSTAARAEHRMALVIGESAYRAVTPLPNPANDARAMSGFLKDAGFEVTSADDLSRDEMNTAVGDFANQIAAKGPDTV